MVESEEVRALMVVPLATVSPPPPTPVDPVEQRRRVIAMNRAARRAAGPRPSRSRFLFRQVQGGGEPLQQREAYQGSLVSPSGNVVFHRYTSRTTVNEAPRGQGEGVQVPISGEALNRRPRRARVEAPQVNQEEDQDRAPPLPNRHLTPEYLNARIDALVSAQHLLNKRVSESNIEFPAIKRRIDDVQIGLGHKIDRLARACNKEHVVNPRT